MDTLKDGSIIKAKWFIPTGGIYYKFPGRVLPKFRIEHQDLFYSESYFSPTHLFTIDCSEVLKRELYNLGDAEKKLKFLKLYRLNPKKMKDRLSRKIHEKLKLDDDIENTEIQDKKRIMEVEARELKEKINVMEGLIGFSIHIS